MFEKYSASGNDFLITHTFSASSNLSHLAKLLCNRYEGIGADGMVILSPHSCYPYQWDFYNSDGSSASMCGNASRCVGLYAFLHSLAPKKHTFLTPSGEIGIEVLSSNYPYSVLSNLGEYKLLQSTPNGLLFDTGVPHLVIFLNNKKDFDSFPLEAMRALRHQYNANINIAYPHNNTYYIKTYERGVEGITLACGTGMASLVAYLQENAMLSSKEVQIIPPLGEMLTFTIDNQSIAFQGEVKKIAKCEINLKDFGVYQ